jgi:hypothetical protein
MAASPGGTTDAGTNGGLRVKKAVEGGDGSDEGSLDAEKLRLTPHHPQRHAQLLPARAPEPFSHLLASFFHAEKWFSNAIASSDDAIVSSDGVVGSLDGAIVSPDGAIVSSDGAIASPDGVVEPPDGAIASSDGAIVSPDGVVEPPDGAVLSADGVVFSSGRTAFGRDRAAQPLVNQPVTHKRPVLPPIGGISSEKRWPRRYKATEPPARVLDCVGKRSATPLSDARPAWNH